MLKQCPDGVECDVSGEGDEAPSNNSQRDPLDRFTSGFIQIMVQPPEQSQARCDFNDAVQAEADERHGPGNQSGDEGNETFGAVVGDGKVLQIASTLDKLATVDCEDRHSLSMRQSCRSRYTGVETDRR